MKMNARLSTISQRSSHPIAFPSLIHICTPRPIVDKKIGVPIRTCIACDLYNTIADYQHLSPSRSIRGAYHRQDSARSARFHNSDYILQVKDENNHLSSHTLPVDCQFLRVQLLKISTII
jgi:hypothetical protein